MIHVTIKTKKVYSHDSSGMPKFETISTTLEDGAQYGKFIKYLPYQNFIPNDLEIVKVTKDGKEIDKSKWEAILKETVNQMTKVEPSLGEKYEAEKQRNDDLQSRLEMLEKMLNKPKEIEPIEPEVSQTETIDTVRDQYFEKVGKKAYHGWDIETLKQKMKE